MPKYPKCPKCSKEFTPNEKVSWKCSSCGSVFSSSISKLMQVRNNVNIKQKESIANLKQKVNNQNEQIRKSKILNVLLACFLTISIISSGVGVYYFNDETNSLQKELKTTNEKYDILLSENKSLQNNILSLSSTNEEYQEKALEYKNTTKKLKTKVNDLKSDITKIKHYRNTYKKLESKYNNLYSKYNDLESKYDNINSEYASLKSENSSLQSQIKSYQSSTSSNYSNTGNNDSSSISSSYTVYVTKTGDKYHISGCRYLSRSKIPIDKTIAQSQGYTACSVCCP